MKTRTPMFIGIEMLSPFAAARGMPEYHVNLMAQVFNLSTKLRWK
jgi:hypothetical protein